MALRFVNMMIDKGLDAKTVKVLLFANMIEKDIHAKTVEEALFVSMVKK